MSGVVGLTSGPGEVIDGIRLAPRMPWRSHFTASGEKLPLRKDDAECGDRPVCTRG